jgi:FtsZ-binding cell division protein ZapB
MFRMLMSTLVVTALPLAGCDMNGAGDGSEPTTTTRGTAPPVVVDDNTMAVNDDVLDTFKTTMSDRLDQAGERIDLIEERAEELPENERASLQAVVDDLQTRRDTLAERVDDLDVASQEAWEEARASIERSWNDLNQAIDNAAERFGLARAPGTLAPGA